MCRLFGMTGGTEPVRATFWLLEAPDSLLRQSRAQPDGAGLGWYRPDGVVERENDTIPAYADADFRREAREICSTTSIAHLRFASTGPVAIENTHPFEQDGLLFAHNGEFGEIERLEQALDPEFRALVHGETDSERFFALVSQETARANGDVGRGITSAAAWIAKHLPVFALNLVLIGQHELWALRYPDCHELHLLERPAGGVRGDRGFDASGTAHTMRVRSPQLAAIPSVVVASEPLDEHPGWSALQPGELVHVARDLVVSRRVVLPDPPARALALDDLDEHAAASQATTDRSLRAASSGDSASA